MVASLSVHHKRDYLLPGNHSRQIRFPTLVFGKESTAFFMGDHPECAKKKNSYQLHGMLLDKSEDYVYTERKPIPIREDSASTGCFIKTVPISCYSVNYAFSFVKKQLII